MGKKHSMETIRKISLAQLGKRNSFYGHKHDRQTLQAYSEARSGKKNPMYGRKHTAATKALIGRKAKLRFKRKQK